jgi:hypothetical protein
MPDDHETARRDWRIPDAWWERLVPVLPPRPPHPWGCQRPRVADRTARAALFFVRRTGGQWHAFNETGRCARRSAHRRFPAWTEADVVGALGAPGRGADDALQGLDGAWLARDGAMTQAPLGGAKGGPAAHGPWQERPQAPRPHRRPRRPARPRGRRRPAACWHAAPCHPREPRSRTARAPRSRSPGAVSGPRL